MNAALYYREKDTFVPSDLTQGPWSDDAQHGGPPAALLASAIESESADNEMVVVRITFELLRPVPLKPLTVETRVARPGKKVQLVAATLSHDGHPVASAVGLKIRAKSIEVPTVKDHGIDPPPVEGPTPRFFHRPGAFATEGVEIRMVEGDFSEPGPGKAWVRLKHPVVDGEETTPLQAVAAAADFGNGVSNHGGTSRDWLFINPDLTIALSRKPVGEWILLDSESQIHDSGTGLASSRLADSQGWLGWSAQTLLVDRLAE